MEQKSNRCEWRDREVDEKEERGERWERGMEDYHGPCCPPGSVWHQFEPSCQWVLIMEDWQRCVAAGSRHIHTHQHIPTLTDMHILLYYMCMRDHTHMHALNYIGDSWHC